MSENFSVSEEIAQLMFEVRERLSFFAELGVDDFETDFVTDVETLKNSFATLKPSTAGQNSSVVLFPAKRELPEKFPVAMPPKTPDAPKHPDATISPLRRNALASTKLSDITSASKSNAADFEKPKFSIVPTVNREPLPDEKIITEKPKFELIQGTMTSKTDSLFGDLTPPNELPPANETVAEIHDFIGDCTRCRLCEGRTKIVNSTGNFQARLMFIGEAPGADEDAQGVPFIGRAGQLLTKIIESIGMKREDVFIGNINRCRPPQNRAPQADEVATCKPFLLREIAVVRPEIIVVLGNTATQNLLDTKVGITKLRGNFQDYFGVKVMPTFHPAYLLRDPSKKRETWEDMKKVRDELAKTNS